jgi:hypothetical protein
MVSGRGAKAKGDKYERELAEYFNSECGINSHRTPLSGGGRKEALADLLGTPGIAIEAKRTEKVQLADFMTQAIKNCGADLPVVITRKNQQATEDSYVFMQLKEWMDLYRAFLTQQGYTHDQPTETDQTTTRKDDAPWDEKN